MASQGDPTGTWHASRRPAHPGPGRRAPSSGRCRSPEAQRGQELADCAPRGGQADVRGRWCGPAPYPPLLQVGLLAFSSRTCSLGRRRPRAHAGRPVLEPASSRTVSCSLRRLEGARGWSGGQSPLPGNPPHSGPAGPHAQAPLRYEQGWGGGVQLAPLTQEFTFPSTPATSAT